MKKIFFLLLLGVSVPVAAEIVSTVSFNPSRLGNYDHLKISRDANFQGGLKAGTLNVASDNGTVTMQWNDTNAANYYNVDTVTGNGANATVNMPSTIFLKTPSFNANTTVSLESGPESTEVEGVNISMTGGLLNFATNNNSYVKELHGGNSNAVAPLQFYTTNLTENTLDINGNEGEEIGLTDKNGGSQGMESTYGFHLARVDIPYPTGEFVKQTGSVSLNSDAALCWVPRCTTAGNVFWVLGLVNGIDKTNPDKSCPKPSVSCSGNTEASLIWVKVENGDDFGYVMGADQNIGACYSNIDSEECIKHSASEQACRDACFEDMNMADECRIAKSPLALQGGSCSSAGIKKSCMGIFGYLVDGAQFSVDRNVCICGYANREYICK